MSNTINKTDLKLNKFAYRHIGPTVEEAAEMLKDIGLRDVDELIDEVIPNDIRIKESLTIGEPMDEYLFLQKLKEVAKKNKVFKSYIGQGYYNTIVPSVILRNMFENPGWYTQYTPYQAEISQGRLESLLNFQTMVTDLTGMDISNASLLDEGTAAAEAMMMFYRKQRRGQEKQKFAVDEKVFPQTIAVVKNRAEQLNIEVVVVDLNQPVDADYFGVLVQYPDRDGEVRDYVSVVADCKAKNIRVGVAADLLSLTLLVPPGEWGADIVLGSTQRFGVPLGYGGPHAAYIAVLDEYKRELPGRVIGVSKDSHGNVAYRMSLQTREQHIKKDKATSNICTAQALLANMAVMYTIYHGKRGLVKVASRIYAKTAYLKKELLAMGYVVNTEYHFDTLTLTADKTVVEALHQTAVEAKVNFRRIDATTMGLSLDETVLDDELNLLLSIFGKVKQKSNLDKFVYSDVVLETFGFSATMKKRFIRTSEYLTHPTFNRNRSETRMMRYLSELEKKDLSLNTSMISLGSCTMKLNAATEMLPLSWSEFSEIHPFAPEEQARGYREIFVTLENYLKDITGLAAVSLQPNSGAQGEYAGLLAIKKYHLSRGEKREMILIPVSAHGTNPASAVMAGLKVVLVKCGENGDVEIDDLKEKAVFHKDNLAGLMVTYPSTHGVFEEGIKEMCQIIHENGGQVYMDGANMNAHIGYINPASIGADVCHLNLHKTFAIPHGGGGPGMGPIAVKEHLAPFLPGHNLVPVDSRDGGVVSAAPWGSASILLISYAYIRLMGSIGLKQATAYAIISANYIKARLESSYSVLYTGVKGRVAHEMIIDFRDFEKGGITVEDVAKRLMDYGFHAPTMSFPVAGTMMIEPTESEDKVELDHFCEAMLEIRKEITEVMEGKVDVDNNVFKNAPHTEQSLLDWQYPYSMEQALFPLYKSRKKRGLLNNKFWPSVGRIDNVYGDRNLMCSCPPLEAYLDD